MPVDGGDVDTSSPCYNDEWELNLQERVSKCYLFSVFTVSAWTIYAVSPYTGSRDGRV